MRRDRSSVCFVETQAFEVIDRFWPIALRPDTLEARTRVVIPSRRDRRM